MPLLNGLKMSKGRRSEMETWINYFEVFLPWIALFDDRIPRKGRNMRTHFFLEKGKGKRKEKEKEKGKQGDKRKEKERVKEKRRQGGKRKGEEVRVKTRAALTSQRSPRVPTSMPTSSATIATRWEIFSKPKVAKPMRRCLNWRKLRFWSLSCLQLCLTSLRDVLCIACVRTTQAWSV